MTGTRAGSRSRSRVRDPRTEGREPADSPQNPLIALGHILLGVTLSCLIATLIFMAVIGVIAGAIYLTK